MDWNDVAKLDDIWLNFGGRGNCHPLPSYENYVSVDLEPPSAGWSVKHDLRDPIPLADGSVSRILTEHFVEHIKLEEISRLLIECYRLLKPGGHMRIACPDYSNPRDRRAFDGCEHDKRNPLHITRTDYHMIRKLIESSPFDDFYFFHYWDGDKFIQRNFDHSLGPIKRTPENDSRCRQDNVFRKVRTFFSDQIFKLTRSGNYTDVEFLSRRGHRLYITSLVVDLYKRGFN